LDKAITAPFPVITPQVISEHAASSVDQQEIASSTDVSPQSQDNEAPSPVLASEQLNFNEGLQPNSSVLINYIPDFEPDDGTDISEPAGTESNQSGGFYLFHTDNEDVKEDKR